MLLKHIFSHALVKNNIVYKLKKTTGFKTQCKKINQALDT